MAGMFYSLQEVAAKLSKTEDEIRDMVKAGQLREFRDGANLLFKMDDVEKLFSESFDLEGDDLAVSDDTGANEVLAGSDDIDLDDSVEADTSSDDELLLSDDADVSEGAESDAGGMMDLSSLGLGDDSEEDDLLADIMPGGEAGSEEPTAADAGDGVDDLMDLGLDDEPAVEPAGDEAGDFDIFADDEPAEAELELTPDDDNTTEDSDGLDDILLPEETTSGSLDALNADTAIIDSGLDLAGSGLDAIPGGFGDDDSLGGGLESSALFGDEGGEGDDLSLDTFGSGGLLDLSLQADDTSLGGILDEIYTSEDQPAGGGAEGLEGGIGGGIEDEPMLADSPVSMPMGGSALRPVYAEAAPTTGSNAIGVSLFIPLIAVIFTIIAAASGMNHVKINIFDAVNKPGPMNINIFWFIVGIGAVVSLAIAGVGSMMGGSSKPKEKKAKKTKAAKKGKTAKPKKEKKGKPKKEKKVKVKKEKKVKPKKEKKAKKKK